MRYSPTKSLTSREKDLIWRFRFFLQKNRKALTFFLKCVNWKDPGEVKQVCVRVRVCMCVSVWKYRKALTLLLKCVNWKDPGEVKQVGGCLCLCACVCVRGHACLCVLCCRLEEAGRGEKGGGGGG